MAEPGVNHFDFGLSRAKWQSDGFLRGEYSEQLLQRIKKRTLGSRDDENIGVSRLFLFFKPSLDFREPTLRVGFHVSSQCAYSRLMTSRSGCRPSCGIASSEGSCGPCKAACAFLTVNSA
jgi:hypothetical protein